MNEAALQVAVGQFLKTVTFKAQRELEKVVRNAVASGKLKHGEPVTASVTLSNDKLDLNITIFSKIEI